MAIANPILLHVAPRKATAIQHSHLNTTYHCPSNTLPTLSSKPLPISPSNLFLLSSTPIFTNAASPHVLFPPCFPSSSSSLPRVFQLLLRGGGRSAPSTTWVANALSPARRRKSSWFVSSCFSNISGAESGSGLGRREMRLGLTAYMVIRCTMCVASGNKGFLVEGMLGMTITEGICSTGSVARKACKGISGARAAGTVPAQLES